MATEATISEPSVIPAPHPTVVPSPNPPTAVPRPRGGHGTREILELTCLLEEHGIFCCLIGVSALLFYGAARGRTEWEVCVRSEQLAEALDLLHSDRLRSRYVPVFEKPLVQPGSLAHTYSRFSGDGQRYQFVLVPSEDAHLPCDPSTSWRSHNGLPYPALPVLAQCFVDTNNSVALCDLIDGANLTEEWGNRHLELDGTTDVAWAKRMNERLYKSWEGDPKTLFASFPTGMVSRRKLWEHWVRAKPGRMGWTQPKEIFETRFRLKNSEDTWKNYSDAS